MLILSFVQCCLYSAPYGTMSFILTCVMCSKGGYDSVSLPFCGVPLVVCTFTSHE